MSGMVAACDAPRPQPPAPPVAQAPAAAPPATLSAQQAADRHQHCLRKSEAQFRKDQKSHQGAAATFSAHYNRKLDACFYVLTLTSANQVKQLYEVGENALYGEFSGPLAADTPAGQIPDSCRVESMFCASEREWNVLVAQYMED